jgi:hypothetical protein
MTALATVAQELAPQEAACTSPLLGEVVNLHTGEPVPGARIAAAGTGDLLASPAGRRRASFSAADRDGRFTVHLDREGALVLAIHAAGYLPAIVPVARRATSVRVALSPGGEITGVCAAGGAPCAGVLVRAFCTQPLDAAEARTDGRGRFALRGLRAGSWTIGRDGAIGCAKVELGEGAAVELELDG